MKKIILFLITIVVSSFSITQAKQNWLEADDLKNQIIEFMDSPETPANCKIAAFMLNSRTRGTFPDLWNQYALALCYSKKGQAFSGQAKCEKETMYIRCK